MGSKEILLNQYLPDNTKFADIFNVIIYDGRQVLNSSMLHDANSELSSSKNNNNHYSVQKQRDVIRKVGIDKIYAIYAIDNQFLSDNPIVARIPLYKGLESDRQLQALRQKNKHSKDLSGDKWISGISNSDKLLPVITLGLYYGEVPWFGAKDLYSLLDFLGIDNKIKPYIGN